MRPNSIVLFERLFFLNLALGLVGYFLNYDAATQMLADDPATAGLGMGGGFLIGTYLIGLVINLLLWYFIARKASNIARWIFVVLVGIGLLFGIPTLFTLGISLIMVTTLIGYAITIAMIALLFREDAKAWFSKDGPTDPQIFE